MNSKIFHTLMMALAEYKRHWVNKRTDDKYGPVPSECQEIIDKQIDCIEQAKSYVRSVPFEDEPISLNPLCEFVKFFTTELNHFDSNGNRIFLTDVQIRELHKIHIYDKVKVNWTRQSGKGTVILSYLTYLATKGKRILIDAPNIRQKEYMLRTIYDMSNCVYDGDDCLKFYGGGSISSEERGFTYDVLFANEYDHIQHYKADSYTWCNNSKFKKVIIVSKKLNNPNFIESKINWNELPGRDECFKQKMIESIGLDEWNREFEVNKMCKEFTATNMRKIADEQNCEADKKMIEKIEKDIKDGANKGDSSYYIHKPLREYVKRHFRLRGFKVKEYYGMSIVTTISW